MSIRVEAGRRTGLYWPGVVLSVFTSLHCFIASAQPAPDSLCIGDAAPPLKVAKWIKGVPVSLEKGRVYIVEFSNTSCGPCRASIPHLAKLAAKFAGQASWISIYVFEEDTPMPDKNGVTEAADTGYIRKVDKFVRFQGTKLNNFHIAVDDTRETMAKTWMTPAGQGGVPVAYVIDRTGTVAWIGYPMELDEVVEQVLAGKFNAKAAMGRVTEEKKVNRIEALYKGGKADQALSELDELIAESPEDAFLLKMKFSILLDKDEAKAYAYGQELIGKPSALSEPVWGYLATDILHKEGMKSRDYDMAIAFLTHAIELSAFDPLKGKYMNARATCYYLKRDYHAAVATEKDAQAYLRTCDQTDPQILELESICERQLEQYKKSTP